MGEHLSPLDATFLELEEADESAHMHIGAAMLFDPLPGGGAPSLGQVRALLGSRLATLPRYRQRLSRPRVGTLGWPHWEADGAYTIEAHVHEAALPPPAGPDELEAFAADYWSTRLDRRRALWDMVLVRGLAEGRWALVTKTHHCLVDGVGAIDAGYLLFDAAEGAAADDGPPHAAPAERGLAGRIVGVPVGAARSALAAAHALTSPASLREGFDRARGLAGLIVHDELVAAPRTSINAPIGTRRRFRVARIELAALRRVRETFGGTVNDAVLALAAGGLRTLLLARSENPPAAGLRAMVPVNRRADEERHALGNRITSLFVELPVAEPDPAARYAEAMRIAERHKSSLAALGGETLIELAGLAPPLVHAAVARSLFATRLFNVTVTNVPGPREVLTVLGAPMREIWPLVPLAAEHAVGLCILSYAGTLYFGVIGDEDRAPDLDVLAQGIEDAFFELLARVPEPTPA